MTERGSLEPVAQHGMAVDAWLARAAGGRPAQDDVIARLHSSHARANLAHDAGALVPEHQRRARRPVVARRVQIAGAHTGCLDLDEHLACAGRVEGGFFDRERLATLPENCGCDFHVLANVAACRARYVTRSPNVAKRGSSVCPRA
jgi:hypothetical protein